MMNDIRMNNVVQSTQDSQTRSKMQLIQFAATVQDNMRPKDDKDGGNSSGASNIDKLMSAVSQAVGPQPPQPAGPSLGYVAPDDSTWAAEDAEKKRKRAEERSQKRKDKRARRKAAIDRLVKERGMTSADAKGLVMSLEPDSEDSEDED
jgi:hypothetical protein